MHAMTAQMRNGNDVVVDDGDDDDDDDDDDNMISKARTTYIKSQRAVQNSVINYIHVETLTSSGTQQQRLQTIKITRS